MHGMQPPLPLARRDVIAARLAGGQAVVATALADEFEVSEDAIRRDLRALAAEGRCRRVYGGALPITPQTQPMFARADVSRARKRALAQRAAGTIRAGEFLFLDAGSTNLALVEFLPEDLALTVATNAIDIAGAVLRRPDLRLVMIGGSVDTTVGGSVDSGAVQAVGRFDIDRCFLGACAVSADGGVSVRHAADASFKRALSAASRERQVLVTSDKLGERAPYRVVALDRIDCLVVEHDAPARDLRALARLGATVLKADKPR